jgi:16S rRNA (cytidine1402-2'-O)-methyltransferase
MGKKVSEPQKEVSNRAGALYVAATPIGNLEDITARALRVLREVALIACEDTRHTAKLLHHFGIATRTLALHEHNEREQVPKLLKRLQGGESIALVSDAGTPLVSDPGFHLVRAAQAAAIRVTPVPGACAAIAALSASGLPSDRFVFEGFPSSKVGERRRRLQELATETRTLIFYEAPHRILDSLRDMADAFGGERPAVVARELTKHFETIRAGSLRELVEWLSRDAAQQQGEFVVSVQGAPPVSDMRAAEAERVLRILLLSALPMSQAAELAAEISGANRRGVYQRALALRAELSKGEG